MRKVSNTELSQAAKTPVLCTFNCIERVSIRKNQTGEKTMATNERMSSVKQTETKKGDKHMNTNGQTATIVASPKRTKRIVGASQRRAEIVIAALFVLNAATSIAAAFVLDPMLNAPNYLAWIFPNKAVVVLAALMWSFNHIRLVFIAVFALPLLRKLDEALAVGYLATRIIEGTIMMFGIVATLLLIPLSQEFLQAGAPHGSWFLPLGEVLKQAKFLGLSEVSTPLLGLGGLLFTWMLFRYRLVPRFISVVGLIGYALVFLYSIPGWFDLINLSPGASGAWGVLALPVAVFEIILLPFWLLFRGFKMPEAPEHPVAE